MQKIDFDWAFHNTHLWECSPPEAYHNHRNSECRDLHYGTPWPPGDPSVWPFWTDALGQQFQAGDLIAVSTISGRSPVLIVAQCVRINRRKKNGELIIGGGYGHYETPTGQLPDGVDRYSANRPKSVRLAGCNVTATPLYSRFGLVRGNYDYKSGTYKDKPRNSTYQFIENIVLLDPNAANIVRAEIAAALAASVANPI